MCCQKVSAFFFIFLCYSEFSSLVQKEDGSVCGHVRCLQIAVNFFLSSPLKERLYYDNFQVLIYELIGEWWLRWGWGRDGAMMMYAWCLGPWTGPDRVAFSTIMSGPFWLPPSFLVWPGPSIISYPLWFIPQHREANRITHPTHYYLEFPNTLWSKETRKLHFDVMTSRKIPCLKITHVLPIFVLLIISQVRR